VTDEAFTEFYQPITHRFDKLRFVKSGERRRLVRRMVTEVEADLYRGERNPEVLEQTARQTFEKEFNSILVIIGLAVLTELVRYIVRKLLERWEKIQ
jgi:hypothetical protein